MSVGTSVLGVQIPANQALSGAFDLGEKKMVALEMPEAWSGSTITFQAKANTRDESHPVEDWDDVYDDTGTEVSVTVGANRVVVIGTVTKSAIGALRHLRIRSGTSASPFNQNPTREIKIIVK